MDWKGVQSGKKSQMDPDGTFLFAGKDLLDNYPPLSITKYLKKTKKNYLLCDMKAFSVGMRINEGQDTTRYIFL